MNERITKEVKNNIDIGVFKILEESGYQLDKDIHVDIVKLVRSYGFKLYRGRLKENDEAYLLIDKSDNTKSIAVCNGLTPEWTRFIIAYELAYYFYHYCDGDFLHIRKKVGKSYEETAIDYFANSLLMPKTKFIKEQERLERKGTNRNTKANILSSMFSVPIMKVYDYMDEVKEQLEYQKTNSDICKIYVYK